MTKYIVITGDVIQSRKYNNLSEKLKNKLKEINYPDNMVIPFKISRGDEIQAVFKDEAINSLLFLIDSFQTEWTDAQWEAIYYYEKEGTYQKAAEKFNIAFQNVEKRCKAAKWKEVELAETPINNLIKDFILVEGE